jgi:prevent-host-death family protein
MVMADSAPTTVTKADFKARALEIFRRVQTTGEPVIITDRGRPVLRLEPYYGDDDASLAALRGSVVAYERPTEPLEPEAWEARVALSGAGVDRPL